MVSPKRALRIAIVVEWVLTLLSVVLSKTLDGHLPEPLLLWSQQHANADLSFLGTIAVVILMPAFVVSVVAAIGLFLFKPWARWLYLLSFVVGYVCLAFLGPTVEHAIANAIADTSAIMSGVVVGIAFFSTALEQGGDSESVD